MTPDYRIMDPVTYRSPTRARLSLAGPWRWAIDPRGEGFAAGWAATGIAALGEIELPAAVQSTRALSSEYPSAAGFPNGYLGTVWFERVFQLPPASAPGPRAAGRNRMVLILGGIAPAAHLFLDGVYLGYHRYPMLSGAMEIPQRLVGGESGPSGGGEHRLTIAVVEQDLGMMGGYRFAGHAWSGVYRDLWIEERPPSGEGWIRSAWLHAAGEELMIEAELSGAVELAGPVEHEVAAVREDRGRPGSTSRPGTAVTAQLRLPGGGDALVGPLRLDAVSSAAKVDAEPAGPAGADGAAGPPRSVTVRAAVSVADVPHWSPEEPRRIELAVTLTTGGCVVDRIERGVGFRRLAAAGRRITEHGRPTFLAGGGGEFYSPTIAPLTDPGLIDRRVAALRKFGLRFYRHHTHVPTPEELTVADERGLYLSAEVSVVSNFAKVVPFADGLEQLSHYVYQSRHHPSLAMYCLGNEGTQVMIDSEVERAHARIAFDAVKDLAPDRLVLAAFGSQGELPDQPNDVETPHLWSHEFRWGHDGFTRVPWWGIRSALDRKPSLIHEYGKFGLWPGVQAPRAADGGPEDAAAIPGYSVRPLLDAQAVLDASCLRMSGDRVSAASRALAGVASRLILESARRCAGVDGFVLWTFFRMGPRNAGLADDWGRPFVASEPFRAAAAETAVISDLGFDRRVFPAGSARPVSFVVVTDAGTNDTRLSVRLDDELVAEADVEAIEAGGRSDVIVTLRPEAVAARRSTLSTTLVTRGGRLLAASAEPVWIVPPSPPRPASGVVTDLADPGVAALFPGSITLGEYDAVVRGCRTWKGRDVSAAIATQPPALVVTDHLGEGCAAGRSAGVPLLLVDTGRFPAEWYPAGYPEGEFDVFRMYVPFRAGWDCGNVATIVEDSLILGTTPHEGWCDLAWFNAIQGARSVRTEAVRAELGSLVPVVRVIPKLPPAPKGPVVQDPYAVREAQHERELSFATEDRAYLLAMLPGAGGNGSSTAPIVVSTLRHGIDEFGRHLLDRIIEELRKPT